MKDTYKSCASKSDVFPCFHVCLSLLSRYPYLPLPQPHLCRPSLFLSQSLYLSLTSTLPLSFFIYLSLSDLYLYPALSDVILLFSSVMFYFNISQAMFGELSWPVTILTIFYSLAGLGIAIVNDFKSIEGDA